MEKEVKVKIIGQTSEKYTSCGDTVYKVEYVEKQKYGRRYGYMLSGVSLPSGMVIERPESWIKKSQAEAFKGL